MYVEIIKHDYPKEGIILESKIGNCKVFILCRAPAIQTLTNNLTRWYTLTLQSDNTRDIGKISNRFFYMHERWAESKL